MNREISKKLSKATCRGIWDWIIQVILWLAIALTIYLMNFNQLVQQDDGPIKYFRRFVTLLIAIIIYVANNIFFSTTFKFLYNEKDSDTLLQVLRGLVSHPPEISFFIEYLEKTQTNCSTSNNETIPNDITTRLTKATSLSDSKDFKYYSARDISGVLRFDKDKNPEKKFFADLSLTLEVNFADSITRYEYEKEKKDFVNPSKFRGEEYKFKERKTIKKLFKEKLIKITDDPPVFAKWYIYITFVFLGIVEFYKLYIKHITITDNFTIKKIISIEGNLDKEEYNEQNPALELYGNIHQFETFVWFNKNFVKKQFTPEEIQKSKRYEEGRQMSESLDSYDEDYNGTGGESGGRLENYYYETYNSVSNNVEEP